MPDIILRQIQFSGHFPCIHASDCRHLQNLALIYGQRIHHRPHPLKIVNGIGVITVDSNLAAIIQRAHTVPRQFTQTVDSIVPHHEYGERFRVRHLAAFAQTLQENYEFPSLERADPEDQDVGVLMLENTYPGLKDLDLEQMEVYLAVISFSGGELAIVEAKSAEDAAKVKEIFQNRITTKSTDGPGNYPEEVEMWKKSAKVVDNGSYVMLVNHPDSEAIAGEFEALFK